MIHPSQQRPLAGHPAHGWAISLTTGRRVRTLRLSPWVAVPAVLVFTVFVTLYLAASAYLLFRDDLLGATMSRQVAMQYEYEDRIAALRTELDRVTSRALVETQSVGVQISSVLERQDAIDRRQAVLDALIAKARESGIVAANAPVPRPRPVATAAGTAAEAAYALGYAPVPQPANVITETLIRDEAGESPAADAEALELRPMLRDVESSLDSVQENQTNAVDALLRASEAEARRLAAALKPIGVTVGDGAMGGPFIPANAHFVEKTATLQRRLDDLAAIRRKADAMPLRSPIEGASRSSGFGSRVDPFLGKAAFHSGIDFVAAEGTPVRATAPGVVTAAGWSGGYGMRIEMRHSDGMVTRFGHLSSILVRQGARIAAGEIIGRVGSTGRSTGAHLHYETRKDGEPVDPAPYLSVGARL